MNPIYTVRDTSAVFSPSLLFFKELIRRNIARAVEMAGSPSKLRPHAKTHKTREIIRLELEAGITKHKCATLAEAEMIASCGAPDVLLAYPIVGPNAGRLACLIAAYPQCHFSVLADDPNAVRALSDVMRTNGTTVDVLIDLDVGMHRTGIAPGPDAVALYEQIAAAPGLKPGGFHVYDGHNHQESVADRDTAVHQLLVPVLAVRATVEAKGLPVPRIVVGGTPTFPVFCKLDLPGAELSPGTFVLHDKGYGSRYADMSGFTPAALLLTRVISRPTPTRVTLDLGYKAIASDPPAERRCFLLDVPDYKIVGQNEEHLIIETPAAERFPPGTAVFAMPWHVCPTCALHRQAYVVEDGRITGQWDIAARDRVLSV